MIMPTMIIFNEIVWQGEAMVKNLCHTYAMDVISNGKILHTSNTFSQALSVESIFFDISCLSNGLTKLLRKFK